MARKGFSRMELRRQAEALEAQQPAGGEAKAAKGKKTAVKAKKTTTTKVKKSKDRPSQRKRLVWVVYSPSMKEEGKFAYDQRAAAEERREALKLKHKKPYFIQPVKEAITDGSAPVAVAIEEDEPEPVAVAEDDEDAEEQDEEEPEEPEEDPGDDE